MGGEAFHGKGPGDAHPLFVLIGFVIEIFKVGFGGNRGIDRLLPGNARHPPGRKQWLSGQGPVGWPFPGNLPLFQRIKCTLPATHHPPLATHHRINLRPQRLQFRLPLFPDHVDLGVVGNRLEGDVGHPFIDKAVAQLAIGGLAGRWCAGDFGILELPFARIGQQIVGVAGAHDAGARQGQGNP